MGKLPVMPYASGIGRVQQVQFAGLQHTDGAQDGAIFDMQNITGDNFPVLQPRKKRETTSVQADTLYGHEKLVRVSGTSLYYGSTLVGTVTAGEKLIAAMGDRILIWPDKLIVNVKDESDITLTAIEKSTTQAGLVFKDGTYKGVSAKANTIKGSGVDWKDYFSPGDAVKIEGCSVHEENNKKPVIREIDGDEMHFYEEVFFLGDDETEYTEPGSVTLTKEAPDLEGLFTSDNRAWGYAGDTIYASKLGDPTNWNVFEGLSTDSWFVESGTPGDFTACCAYLGYPMFFKEDAIFKVYGAKPTNFQTQKSAATGVPKGNDRTLAVAGEILFWLGRHGVVSYTGGMPEEISQVFGTIRFVTGIAGSDGKKYVLSGKTAGQDWHLMVYDTELGQWYREDSLHAESMASVGGVLYAAPSSGNVLILNSDSGNEIAFTSWIQFADFVENELNRKELSRLQMRLEIGQGATVTVKMQCDAEEQWQTVRVLTAQKKMSVRMPVKPRRCDRFRIRIEGTGEWKLWSMAREVRVGSGKNGSPSRDVLDF